MYNNVPHLAMYLIHVWWLNVVHWPAVLGGQEFHVQPDPLQSAVQDSTIVLKCIVKNREGQVQWTRGGFGLGTDRSLPEFDRYTIIGRENHLDSNRLGKCYVFFYIITI